MCIMFPEIDLTFTETQTTLSLLESKKNEVRSVRKYLLQGWCVSKEIISVILYFFAEAYTVFFYILTEKIKVGVIEKGVDPLIL